MLGVRSGTDRLEERRHSVRGEQLQARQVNTLFTEQKVFFLSLTQTAEP